MLSTFVTKNSHKKVKINLPETPAERKKLTPIELTLQPGMDLNAEIETKTEIPILLQNLHLKEGSLKLEICDFNQIIKKLITVAGHYKKMILAQDSKSEAMAEQIPVSTDPIYCRNLQLALEDLLKDERDYVISKTVNRFLDWNTSNLIRQYAVESMTAEEEKKLSQYKNNYYYYSSNEIRTFKKGIQDRMGFLQKMDICSESILSRWNSEPCRPDFCLKPGTGYWRTPYTNFWDKWNPFHGMGASRDNDEYVVTSPTVTWSEAQHAYRTDFLRRAFSKEALSFPSYRRQLSFILEDFLAADLLITDMLTHTNELLKIINKKSSPKEIKKLSVVINQMRQEVNNIHRNLNILFQPTVHFSTDELGITLTKFLNRFSGTLAMQIRALDQETIGFKDKGGDHFSFDFNLSKLKLVLNEFYSIYGSDTALAELVDRRRFTLLIRCELSNVENTSTSSGRKFGGTLFLDHVSAATTTSSVMTATTATTTASVKTYFS